MLEFIVLGLVPGTHIQLGFRDVLLLAAVLGIGIIMELELVHYFKTHPLVSRHNDTTHTAGA